MKIYIVLEHHTLENSKKKYPISEHRTLENRNLPSVNIVH